MYSRKELLMTIKKRLLILAILSVIIATSYFVGSRYERVQPWLNMTKAEAEGQSNRAIMKSAMACEDQGGQWISGFSQAYCTIAYTPPDITSWWIQPIENPYSENAENLRMALMLIMIISGTGFITETLELMVIVVNRR